MLEELEADLSVGRVEKPRQVRPASDWWGSADILIASPGATRHADTSACGHRTSVRGDQAQATDLAWCCRPLSHWRRTEFKMSQVYQRTAVCDHNIKEIGERRKELLQEQQHVAHEVLA